MVTGSALDGLPGDLFTTSYVLGNTGVTGSAFTGQNEANSRPFGLLNDSVLVNGASAGHQPVESDQATC